MLEIGALKPDNYASSSKWILNTPIDLRSNHPDITEQDFLLRPLPKRDDDRFDVISCSLVINFVPDVRDRGKVICQTLILTQCRPNAAVVPGTPQTNALFASVCGAATPVRHQLPLHNDGELQRACDSCRVLLS